MKNKLIIHFTALVFIYGIVSQPLFAVMTQPQNVGAPQILSVDEPIIPHSLGKITSVKIFGDLSSQNRIIINIQDLHCNPKMQRNISEILKSLEVRYGLQDIYAEGAYSNVSAAWINEIDEDKKKAFIDAFLNSGRLSGSEYYSVMSDGKMIKGLEDSTLHSSNLAKFGNILEKQNYYVFQMQALDKELALLINKYFNFENKRFNELLIRYKAGKISSDKYYRSLIKYIDKANRDQDKYNSIYYINLDAYPNLKRYFAVNDLAKLLNHNRIAAQMRLFLDELKVKLPYGAYRNLNDKTANFTNFADLYVYIPKILKDYNIILDDSVSDLKLFLDYLAKEQEFNPLDLVKEEKRLIEKIRLGLSQDKNELEISFAADFYSYLKDYMQASITADDYRYFRENFTEFKKIWEKYVYDSALNKLTDSFKEINEFYDANFKRDDIFSDKLSISENKNVVEICDKEITPQKLQSALKNAQICAVITGGFHSEGLQNICEKNRVSYIAVTPNVSDAASSNEVYKQLVKQQAKKRLQIKNEESQIDGKRKIAGGRFTPNIAAFTNGEILKSDVKSYAIALALASNDAKVEFKNNTAIVRLNGETLALKWDGKNFNFEESASDTPQKSKVFTKEILNDIKNHFETIGKFASITKNPQIFLRIIALLAASGVDRGFLMGNGLIFEIASSEKLQNLIRENENINLNQLAGMPDSLQKIILEIEILQREYSLSRQYWLGDIKSKYKDNPFITALLNTPEFVNLFAFIKSDKSSASYRAADKKDDALSKYLSYMTEENRVKIENFILNYIGENNKDKFLKSDISESDMEEFLKTIFPSLQNLTWTVDENGINFSFAAEGTAVKFRYDSNKIFKMFNPQDASLFLDKSCLEIFKQIRDTAQKAGFEIYIQGGMIRDLFLGAQPNDMDLSARKIRRDADFKELFALLQKTFKNFAVNLNDARAKPSIAFEDDIKIEISLSEDDYKKEAQWRDASVNALFYSFSGDIIDITNRGFEDLLNREIFLINDGIFNNADNSTAQDIIKGVYRIIKLADRTGFNFPHKVTALLNDKKFIDKIIHEFKSLDIELQKSNSAWRLDYLFSLNNFSKAIELLPVKMLSAAVVSLDEVSPKSFKEALKNARMIKRSDSRNKKFAALLTAFDRKTAENLLNDYYPKTYATNFSLQDVFLTQNDISEILSEYDKFKSASVKTKKSYGMPRFIKSLLAMPFSNKLNKEVRLVLHNVSNKKNLSEVLNDSIASYTDIDGRTYTNVYFVNSDKISLSQEKLQNIGWKTDNKDVWISRQKDALIIVSDAPAENIIEDFSRVFSSEGKFKSGAKTADIIEKTAGLNLNNAKVSIIADYNTDDNYGTYNNNGKLTVSANILGNKEELLAANLARFDGIRTAHAKAIAETFYVYMDVNNLQELQNCLAALNATGIKNLIVDFDIFRGVKEEKIIKILELAKSNQIFIFAKEESSANISDRRNYAERLGFQGYVEIQNNKMYKYENIGDKREEIAAIEGYENQEQLEEKLKNQKSRNKAVKLSELLNVYDGKNRSLMGRIAVIEIFKSAALKFHNGKIRDTAYQKSVGYNFSERLVLENADLEKFSEAVKANSSLKAQEALGIIEQTGAYLHLKQLEKSVSDDAQLLDELKIEFMKGMLIKDLAAAELQKEGVLNGLANENFEILLGEKLLQKRIEKIKDASLSPEIEKYIQDETTMLSDFNNKIKELAAKNSPQAVNDVIRLILLSEPKMDKREIIKTESFNASAINAILAAA
ncbi:MAG: hypothetical protein LBQ47_02015 [Endomicrobium sp.]|jgi:tRNA nucleotidyltransferase/poly(A) polymerase|nr:hypothetical protein [Endomicrobium sp.]